jgi:hypothetical protein
MEIHHAMASALKPEVFRQLYADFASQKPPGFAFLNRCKSLEAYVGVCRMTHRLPGMT